MAKLNLDRPLADAERLAAVDRLAAVWGDGPFGRLIARVAVLLAEDTVWPELTTKAALRELFRSRGLVPPALVARCQALSMSDSAPAGATAEEISVNFAACLFPQRSYQLEQAELTERLAIWLPSLAPLRSMVCGTEDDCLAAARLVPALATLGTAIETLSELLTDLTGASLLAGQTAAGSPGRREWLDRRMGAVLHLATCKPDSVAPMLVRHQESSAPLRFVRRAATTLPSRLILSERSRAFPSWPAVGQGLAQYFPSETPATLALTVRLERMAWHEARQWVRSPLVEERCADFWELMWAKLSAGFPYYGFRASLATWWKQCASRYRFSTRQPQSLDDDFAPVAAGSLPAAATSAEPPSLDQLRAWRELYRVIRSTFYANQPQDPARDNERRRRAIDALWQGRIENRIEGDLPATLLAEVNARFPDLTPATLNNLNRRLRMRLFAGKLARFGRLSNSAIRSAPPNDVVRHAISSAAPPLAEEAAIPGLVSLVKAAAPKATLLGPLSAQFAHGTLADPRWKDPWTFPRYLGELWCWLGIAGSADAEPSARENSALEAAIRAILSSPAWLALIGELLSASDQERADALIASRSWDEPQSVARQAFARALDAQAIDSFQPARVRKWRKLADGNWLVPVWYLTVIERVDQELLLERLSVDGSEVEGVVALHRAMAEDCLPPPRT